jgi:hypothetical protein
MSQRPIRVTNFSRRVRLAGELIGGFNIPLHCEGERQAKLPEVVIELLRAAATKWHVERSVLLRHLIAALDSELDDALAQEALVERWNKGSA